MKRSVRIWRVVLAALMTLAVVLVWPPEGAESASSVHAAVTPSHSHHGHAEKKAPQQVRHSTLDEDCPVSAIGCCMMTHCHPGISVDPHQMNTMAVSDETAASAAVRGLGSDPGVILPPPRRVLL